MKDQQSTSVHYSDMLHLYMLPPLPHVFPPAHLFLGCRGILSPGMASASVLAGIPGRPSGSSRTLNCFWGDIGLAALSAGSARALSIVQPISLQATAHG